MSGYNGEETGRNDFDEDNDFFDEGTPDDGDDQRGWLRRHTTGIVVVAALIGGGLAVADNEEVQSRFDAAVQAAKTANSPTRTPSAAATSESASPTISASPEASPSASPTSSPSVPTAKASPSSKATSTAAPKPSNKPRPSKPGGPGALAKEAVQTIWSLNGLGTNHTLGRNDGYGPGAVRTSKIAQIVDKEKPDVVGWQEMQIDQGRVARKILQDDYYFIPKNTGYGTMAQNSLLIRKDRYKLLERHAEKRLYFNGATAYMPDATVKDRVTGEVSRFANRHSPAETRKFKNQFWFRHVNAKRDYADAEAMGAIGRPYYLIGDLNEASRRRDQDHQAKRRSDMAYCVLTQEQGGKRVLQNTGSIYQKDPGWCRELDGKGPKWSVDWVLGPPNTIVKHWEVDKSLWDRRLNDHPVVKTTILSAGGQAAVARHKRAIANKSKSDAVKPQQTASPEPTSPAELPLYGNRPGASRAEVIRGAEAFIRKNADVKRGAIVLDIDRTSLDKYGKPLRDMRHAARLADHVGLTVLYNTGRWGSSKTKHDQIDIARSQLKRGGFPIDSANNVQGRRNKHESLTARKQKVRKLFAGRGYDLVLNIGNNSPDFSTSTKYGVNFRLPNPNNAP